MNRMQTLATVAAAGLLFAAILALISGRPVLAGTLLIFTAFAIYLREIHGREESM